MFCHKCGNKIDVAAVFCSKCGTKVATDESIQQVSASPASTKLVQPQLQSSADLTATVIPSHATIPLTDTETIVNTIELVVTILKVEGRAYSKLKFAVFVDDMPMGELPNGGTSAYQITLGQHCVKIGSTSIWIDVPKGYSPVTLNLQWGENIKPKIVCDQDHLVTKPSETEKITIRALVKSLNVVSALGLIGIILGTIGLIAGFMLFPSSSGYIVTAEQHVANSVTMNFTLCFLISGLVFIIAGAIMLILSSRKCCNKSHEGTAVQQKRGVNLIEDKSVPDTLDTNRPIPTMSKKTHKKLIFGLVGIAVVAIAMIAIVLNLGGGTEYPDELLYEGLPVTQFLEMTRDDFIAEFGEPDQSYPDYPGICYDDKGISLINFSEETGKVIHMNFYSETCTFNGKKFVDTTTEKALKNLATSDGTQVTPSNIIDYSFYSGINQVTDPKYKFFRVIEDDHTIEFITYEDYVVNIFLCSNEMNEINPFLNGESGGYDDDSDITYFVEFSNSYSEGYEPAIMLYQDGLFSFLANMGEGVGFYNGTYSVNGDIYTFSVTETEFSGNKTSFEFEFSMRLNGDTLIYESEDMLGLTMKGSVFSLSATPPRSIIDASNYEETYEGEIPFGYEGEEEDLTNANAYIDGQFEWVTMPEARGIYINNVRMGSAIQGTIKNITSETFNNVSIAFSLYDSSGNQIGDTSDSISNFVGGNTWKFEATILNGNPSRFEFAGITAW